MTGNPIYWCTEHGSVADLGSKWPCRHVLSVGSFLELGPCVIVNAIVVYEEAAVNA